MEPARPATSMETRPAESKVSRSVGNCRPPASLGSRWHADDCEQQEEGYERHVYEKGHPPGKGFRQGTGKHRPAESGDRPDARLGPEHLWHQRGRKHLRNQRIADGGDDPFADPLADPPAQHGVHVGGKGSRQRSDQEDQGGGKENGPGAVSLLEQRGAGARHDRSHQIEGHRPREQFRPTDLADCRRQDRAYQKPVEGIQRYPHAQHGRRREIARCEQFDPAPAHCYIQSLVESAGNQRICVVRRLGRWLHDFISPVGFRSCGMLQPQPLLR